MLADRADRHRPVRAPGRHVCGTAPHPREKAIFLSALAPPPFSRGQFPRSPASSRGAWTARHVAGAL
ncbi:hypothetical protein NL676_016356 [Syzygium grande]|nr:hypothetical protein NL676_016356 [Syzygium grande]